MRGARGKVLLARKPGGPFKAKLAALWQAIKDKISEWLSPVPPRWTRFMNALKANLQDLQSPGNEKVVAFGLMVVGIAIAAVLVKSLPLLGALLAILGFTSLVNLATRVSRIPSMFFKLSISAT